MTVWLVVEGRPQIVRADSVASFTIAPVEPAGPGNADPFARLPRWGLMRIIAVTASPRDADAVLRTVLITFKGDDKKAVKLLSELAERIDAAGQRTRSPDGKQVLYVHGPRPNFDPEWHISEELPAPGHWPRSKNAPPP